MLPANYTVPASTSWAFTRWRIPRLRSRTSNCSLLRIYLPPKGRKAESAWLADLQLTVYPHKWSPVSRRSSAGQRPTFQHCVVEADVALTDVGYYRLLYVQRYSEVAGKEVIHSTLTRQYAYSSKQRQVAQLSQRGRAMLHVYSYSFKYNTSCVVF